MKKMLTTLLILLLVFTSVPVKAEQGESLYYDYAYYITHKNGDESLFPLRDLSESMGYKVDWDNSEKIAIIKKDDQEYKFKIGTDIAYNDKEEIKLKGKTILAYSDGFTKTFVEKNIVRSIFKKEMTFLEKPFNLYVIGDVEEFKKAEEAQKIQVPGFGYRASAENDINYPTIQKILEKFSPVKDLDKEPVFKSINRHNDITDFYSMKIIGKGEKDSNPKEMAKVNFSFNDDVLMSYRFENLEYSIDKKENFTVDDAMKLANDFSAEILKSKDKVKDKSSIEKGKKITGVYVAEDGGEIIVNMQYGYIEEYKSN